MKVDNSDISLAIRALGWLSQHEALRERFLSLTGMEAGDVQSRLDDYAFLGAVIGFLGYNDDTLEACAAALSAQPEDLAAAGRRLGAT